MKYTFNLIIILLFITACSDSAKEKNTVYRDPEVAIKVDPEEDDEVSVFDYFSEIEVISLETNVESVFNYPFDKFVVSGDKYYFLDEKQESIFVFGPEGQFLKKINKSGKGPGEYSLLYDFNINRFTGDLELMSAIGYIQVYDAMGDVHKETIILPSSEVRSVSYFTNLTPDVYLFFANYAEGEKMLFFSKKDKKIMAKSYDFPDFIMRETVFKHSNNPFHTYKDTVRFYQAYNGDIFDINSSDYSLKPRYQWDMGSYNFDISLLPDNESQEYYVNLVRTINSKYAMMFLLNRENDNYFMTRFMFKGMHKSLVYNKADGSYKLFHKFKEGFQCVPYFMDNEYMYTSFSPEYLNMVILSDVLDKENREKLERVKETDNPVIIRYKFK